MAVEAKNRIAQTEGTATLSQRRAETPGQTAAAKKRPMGASRTTGHRHGNCRKRSLGSRFQRGREMGSWRSRTAIGMSARTATLWNDVLPGLKGETWGTRLSLVGRVLRRQARSRPP